MRFGVWWVRKFEVLVMVGLVVSKFSKWTWSMPQPLKMSDRLTITLKVIKCVRMIKKNKKDKREPGHLDLAN